MDNRFLPHNSHLEEPGAFVQLDPHLRPLARLPLVNRSNLMNRLFNEFENYLAHGAFMIAINDIARNRKLLPATFSTYSDWIRGDVLKRNKREIYLLSVYSSCGKFLAKSG